MPFRTLIIDSHSKLEYSLGYFVFRSASETKRININEIQCVIVQSLAVSITSSLLCELIKNNINIIFCDEKRNPHSQLLPLYGSYNSFKKYSQQINWSKEIKDYVWKLIIKEKIKGETHFLKSIQNEEILNMLYEYINQVEDGDVTNREGHAAKVYFNNIFGKDFTRSDDSKMNIYLNYGYSIIASYISRTIVSLGYLTQLGIHHIGVDNEFNFTYDLIEPFRIYVDMYAKNIKDEENFKDKLSNILNEYISIDDKKQSIANAISIYVQSVITALNEEDPKYIIFPDNYEL